MHIFLVPDQPNSSTSEPDIGLLQVGSDTEGDTPAEPSNQYRYTPNVYILNWGLVTQTL